MIRYSCPRCNSILESPDHKAGDKVTCPKCQQRLQIPGPPRDKTVLAAHSPPPQATTSAPAPLPQAIPVLQAPQAKPLAAPVQAPQAIPMPHPVTNAIQPQPEPCHSEPVIVFSSRGIAARRTRMRLAVLFGLLLVLVAAITGLVVLVGGRNKGESLPAGVVRIKGEFAGEPRVLKGHTMPVVAVAFSTDGKELISAGGLSPRGGELVVWDTRKGEIKKAPRQVENHGRTFLSFDGKLLLGGEGTFWDTEGKKVRQLDRGDHTKERAPAALASALFAFAERGEGVMISAVSLDSKPRQVPGSDGDDQLGRHILYDPPATAFSRDETIVACGTSLGALLVWNHKTKKEPQRIQLPDQADFIVKPAVIQALAISHANTRIAVAGPNELKVFDLETGKQIFTVPGLEKWSPGAPYQRLLFSPCGTIVAWLQPSTILLVDAGTGRETGRIVYRTTHCTCFAFSPDGTLLAVGTQDNEVHLRTLR